MIPGMPLELYEEIIDAVGAWPVTEDDHNPDREFTLRSCTLVCRAWRSRAQHQLFRHIELTDEASMKRLVTLFDDAPQLETDVKSLRIRSSNLYHPRDVFVLAPVELWGRLPSLTSLFVSHLGIDTHDVDPDSSIKRGHTLPLHPHLPIVFSAFRNVVELTLWGTKFGNFSDCARVLDGFQNLHTLTIRSVQSFLSQEGSDYESETCSRGRPFLDKLRCLHVESPCYLGIQTLLSTLRPDILTTLGVTLMFYLDGSTYMSGVGPYHSPISITRFAKLRRLVVTFSQDLGYGPPEDWSRDVFSGLMKEWFPMTTASHVLKLSFYIRCRRMNLEDPYAVCFVNRQRYLDMVCVQARVVDGYYARPQSKGHPAIHVESLNIPADELDGPTIGEDIIKMFPEAQKRQVHPVTERSIDANGGYRWNPTDPLDENGWNRWRPYGTGYGIVYQYSSL